MGSRHFARFSIGSQSQLRHIHALLFALFRSDYLYSTLEAHTCAKAEQAKTKMLFFKTRWPEEKETALMNNVFVWISLQLLKVCQLWRASTCICYYATIPLMLRPYILVSQILIQIRSKVQLQG